MAEFVQSSSKNFLSCDRETKLASSCVCMAQSNTAGNNWSCMDINVRSCEQDGEHALYFSPVLYVTVKNYHG